ncbi:hypothetical protein BGZ46_002324 [Entomortierella lignicola]|nr:hypothetical protein BGZ46_002324 [Entomortierella lignicola]
MLSLDHQKLTCEHCGTDFNGRNEKFMRSHFYQDHALSYTLNEKSENEGSEDVKDEDDANKTYQDPVTVPKHLPFLNDFKPSSSSNEKKRGHIREYESALLEALGCLNLEKDRQNHVLWIAKELGLRPVILSDDQGVEQACLTNQNTLQKLVNRPLSSTIVKTVVDSNKKRNTDPCESCSAKVSPELETLLSSSPVSKMLLTRTYTELDDKHCQILNTEWTFLKGLRFACARLLSGAIMLNTINGEAIILNTVEAYCRDRTLDAHREIMIASMGEAVDTSLPDSGLCHYKYIWPRTVYFFENQPRLIVGTKSCNILVTSSLRLDVNGEKRNSLGGTTMSFKLSDDRSSRGIRIFLDEKSIEQAHILATDREAWTVDLEDQMTSLRQLRSQFDESTTYSLCRASGPFTTSRCRQPFTIFTLATSDRFQSFGKIKTIATLFNEIAKEVLGHGINGRLKLKFVQDAQKFYGTVNDDDKTIRKTNQLNKIALHEIINLFGSGSDSLVIIGNSDLNKHLEVLANSLSLNEANEKASSTSDEEMDITDRNRRSQIPSRQTLDSDEGSSMDLDDDFNSMSEDADSNMEDPKLPERVFPELILTLADPVGSRFYEILYWIMI